MYYCSCVCIPLYDPERHDQRWYCDPVTDEYACEVKKMLYMTKTRLQCGAKHELVTMNVMYPRELSPQDSVTCRVGGPGVKQNKQVLIQVYS